MASSRASSPAGESEPASPERLTPRSKVKALMAALDDDSDGGLTTTKRQLDLSSKNTSTQLEASHSSPSSEELSRREESDLEEDDGVVKPRGRLAARMHIDESDKEQVEEETAAARVRRMMTAEREKPSEAAESIHTESSEGDKVVPTRRITKRQRTVATPTPSPSQYVAGSGLFVSPAGSVASRASRKADSDEDDLPANPAANKRFMELVEKKRRERLQKEEEQKRQKAEAEAKRQARQIQTADSGSDVTDDDADQRLTQSSRPTRKASKKALEEMHRETQRMSRNMQLAHEARTRKKITKSSLFAKFNYKPEGFTEDPILEPSSSSPVAQSDIEHGDTPPTSPLADMDGQFKKAQTVEASRVLAPAQLNISGEEHEDIPALHDALIQPNKVDKGKGKAIEVEEIIAEPLKRRNITAFTQRQIRVQAPKIPTKDTYTVDSDSDLEITTAKTPSRKTKLEKMFDGLPAKQSKENHSLHALRMLAHITSPGKQAPRAKQNTKPSITSTELHMSLQQRARQQAAREKEERMQDLRRRGVIVQSAEERQKEMADVEDLIANARREGEEILKKEKSAAKKQRAMNGEAEPLENSEDDEDWEEEKAHFAEQLSGSESEEDDEGNDGDSEEGDGESDEDEETMSQAEEAEKARPAVASMMIDDAASEDASDDGDEELLDDAEMEDLSEDESQDITIQSRRRNHNIVLSDDEDDVTQATKLPNTESPASRFAGSPIAPPSVLRSATKTFIPGITVAGPAGLGLTQIFAGTMDDSQDQSQPDFPFSDRPQSPQLDSDQDSMVLLRNVYPPNMPLYQPIIIDEDSQEIVMDSQTQLDEEPMESLKLDFDQSQVHGFDSLLETQSSEIVESTQDCGFVEMTPIKGRFNEPPPSTVDTVLLGSTFEAPVQSTQPETPIMKKKGRLQRRARTSSPLEVEEAEPVVSTIQDNMEISVSVFDVMRKASKKEATVTDFDKKKSGAKEMVNEQAEESEDEYAGLGGNSDDESGGEEDAFVKEMIDDDEAGKNVDDSELAAFYADKERKNDEKQVEKLFKDITNGTLRRKRGADYDLSDSDDDGEARRRMKRKEFAKMRKALLEDEAVGKIAENPKRLAFLRAIEDRGDDDEVDFLEEVSGSQDIVMDSQSQSESQDRPEGENNTQNGTNMGPPKRKLPADAESAERLPPHLRRTRGPAKRPSNLSEIRESLSSLIEDPNSNLEHNLDSDSELEIEGGDESNASRREKEKENRDPFASRRSKSSVIVDRISLKRNSSSGLSTSNRLAFAASSSAPGFKVPALLRRATTNSSVTSTSGSSVSGSTNGSGFGNDNKTVAKKAGKNSGVHYFARENERKAAVKEREKTRELKRFKGAEKRREVVGSLFGKGKFE